MKKENLIEENVFFLEFEKGRKGGTHHIPEDMLDELAHRPDCVCVQMKRIVYDVATGECESLNYENFPKNALPKMIRGDYFLLHKGVSPEAAMQYLYGHRFWDAYNALEQDRDCIGIVSKRFELASDGSVIQEDAPVVLKKFGLPCEAGEISLPAGFQPKHRK